VTNTGVPFGLGEGHGSIVAGLEIIGILILFFAIRIRNRLEAIGFGLAIGGVLGKFFEPFIQPSGMFQGSVIDWIHLSIYPPKFNLADVWLRAGIVLVVIARLFTRREPALVIGPKALDTIAP
jgi:signal peptidase II